MIWDGKKPRKLLKNHPFMSGSSIFYLVCLLGFGILIPGCGSLPKQSAEAQQERQGAGGQTEQATPVDVAIARKGVLQEQLEYTGTTTPFSTVSLRSQVEGRLVALNVDIGDTLTKGQIVGQIDDAILRTTLNQAEAELAALESEVARATTQVSNARVEQERARLELTQAIADANRQEKLYKEGAIAQQATEQARTTAKTAEQAFRAAQEQVRTEQKAVAAAKGRLIAQQAVVAQAKERKSYTRLTSPIAGAVLEKVTEPGNLLQPGNEILKIGDFSRVKVRVEVSEKELGQVQQGQSVQVRLDAFPDQNYIGTVKRISLAADATARLIPVEIEIPNSDSKIGSGLLARVNFASGKQERVVVPLTAIQEEAGGKETPTQNSKSNIQNRQGRVFVINKGEGKTTVTAKSVRLGKRADGKVEIISGLQPGEAYVVRSGKPLKDGNTVSLSILSEKLNSTRE